MRWSVRRDGRRTFHEQRFRTQAEALRFCDDLNVKLSRGHNPQVRDGRRLFQEYAREWLASLHDVAPRTRQSYETLFRVHVFPAFGGRQLRDIRRSDCEAYVRALRAKGLAPPTIKHAYTPLKRVLGRAVADEILATNPAVGVALPTDKSTGRAKPRPAFLTEDQVEALARVLDDQPPNGLLVRFMAYTGLRCGELSGLNIGDVKLRTCTSTAPARRPRAAGRSTCPKTHGSDREVPLPGWLANDLAAYLAAHPRRHDPDAPLWPGRHRYPDLLTYGVLNWDEPWERGVFSKAVFKPALARAGLPATVRLHDLRHTYISILASKGVPAYRIAKYAGHADVHTTLSIYTHLFKTDEAADMELLGRTPAATSCNARWQAAGTVLSLT